MNKHPSRNTVWLMAALAAFVAGYQIGPVLRSGDFFGTSGPDSSYGESQGDDGGPGASGRSQSRKYGPDSAAALAASAQDLTKEGDRIQRVGKTNQLLGQLSTDNAAAVLDALSGDQDELAVHEITLVAYAWGQMDPERALAYAEGKDSACRRYILGPLLAGWASRDPDAAVAWYRAQELSKIDGDYVCFGLFDGLLKSHPDKALLLLESETDPGKCMSWADSLVRWQVNQGRLEDARKVIERMAADGKTNARGLVGMVRKVAGIWAREDPRAAADWVMNMPESPSYQGPMTQILRIWGREDPTAASQYLADLSASKSRDHAAYDFSRIIVGEDPEAAAIWADSIGDQKIRESALVRVLQEWNQIDPVAARHWLRKCDLEVEARIKAIEPPEQDIWESWDYRGAPKNNR